MSNTFEHGPCWGRNSRAIRRIVKAMRLRDGEHVLCIYRGLNQDDLEFHYHRKWVDTPAPIFADAVEEGLIFTFLGPSDRNHLCHFLRTYGFDDTDTRAMWE